MCGRYNFSKESSSEMVQAVLENLQSRQIEVKTGEVRILSSSFTIISSIFCTKLRIY